MLIPVPPPLPQPPPSQSRSCLKLWDLPLPPSSGLSTLVSLRISRLSLFMPLRLERLTFSSLFHDSDALTLASFLLTAGRVADISSPKWVFIMGLAFLGVINLGIGFVETPIQLFVLRAIAGGTPSPVLLGNQFSNLSKLTSPSRYLRNRCSRNHPSSLVPYRSHLREGGTRACHRDFWR